MKLATKVAYNTIVQIISKVIATAIGLVAIAFITRYLGQSGFGEYTTVLTFISFFAIMADLGLTLVTVLMITQPKVDQDKMLANLLGLRLVSAIIFLGLAPLTVLFFPYAPMVKIGVAITTFSFLAIALNQILVGLFQKNLRLDKVAIAEVASRLALVAGIIVAVCLDLGLYGILIATVLANLLSFLMHYLFSRSFARISLRFNFAVWRYIISKSWPLAITIFFNLIYLKTDILLLSIIKRPSDIGIFAEVGIYGAAYKVIDVLITFPFIFAGIIFPLLAARWAKGEHDQFKQIIQKAFDVMVILALPITVGTQFIARPVMVVVAGEDFALSAPVLQILIIAAGLIFLSVAFSHAVIAMGKQRRIIPAYIFVAITAVIGYLIFIPRFSYFGAAWVTIYSELAITLASAYMVWKYARFKPSFNILAKSLGAAIVMALAIFLFMNTISGNLWLVLSLALIVYFPTLFFMGGLTRQDMLNLLNKN